jgi:hypothetical protein
MGRNDVVVRMTWSKMTSVTSEYKDLIEDDVSLLRLCPVKLDSPNTCRYETHGELVDGT